MWWIIALGLVLVFIGGFLAGVGWGALQTEKEEYSYLTFKQRQEAQSKLNAFYRGVVDKVGS